MKKFLASDIDGTLLHVKETKGVRDYHIDPSVFEAIAEFRRQGNLFVFCTGRTLQGVQAITHNFPFEADGAIIAGGASFHFITNTNPLETRRLANFPIHPELANEVIEYYHNRDGFNLYWSDGERDYAFSDRRTAWMDENTPEYLSLGEWLRNPRNVSSISITPEDPTLEAVLSARDSARERWENKLEIHRNKLSLDICTKGVSKGTGITRMEELISGRDSEYICYAVGDAFNDLPMFRSVGKEHSYLIEGGDPELQPYVKKIVPNVAKCIEDILGG